MKNVQSDESDDDTRSGQQHGAGRSTSGVSKESARSLSSAGREDSNAVSAKDPRKEDREKGDEALLKALKDAVDRGHASSDEREGSVDLLRLGLSMSTSGPLPPANEFKQYPKDIQERMCRWNDAYTVDESKRQDKLVDNEIKQSSRGSILSAFLLCIFGIFAFFLFLITRDANSAWFLSVPVLTIIGNTLQPVFSRSSRDKRENTEQADK